MISFDVKVRLSSGMYLNHNNFLFNQMAAVHEQLKAKSAISTLFQPTETHQDDTRVLQPHLSQMDCNSTDLIYIFHFLQESYRAKAR